VSHSTLDLPARLAVGELDGNRTPDLVVTHRLDSRVTIIQQPGRPQNARVSTIELEAPAAGLAIGRVDRDAHLDLVFSTLVGIEIRFGDGLGGFARRVSAEVLSGAPSIAVADIDADGSSDLIAGIGSSLQVLWSADSLASLREEELQALSPVVIDTGQRFEDFELSDLRGDGRFEAIIVGTQSIDVASIEIGGGEVGRLVEVERYSMNASSRGVALADVDEDGHSDLASAEFAARTVTVYPGRRGTRSGRFRRSDTDGDSRITISDALFTAGHLFTGREPLFCPDAADADDSGAINLSDVIFSLLFLFQGGAVPPSPGPRFCGVDETVDDFERCFHECR